jgi:hypothetical protein
MQTTAWSIPLVSMCLFCEESILYFWAIKTECSHEQLSVWIIQRIKNEI